MGLLLLDQAGAPNQLLSQLQLWLNADLLSMIDSPEQGLVVCFGLACAGSVFGCRSSVGLRCVRWAYSDFGACFCGGSLHVMVEGE